MDLLFAVSFDFAVLEFEISHLFYSLFFDFLESHFRFFVLSGALVVYLVVEGHKKGLFRVQLRINEFTRIFGQYGNRLNFFDFQIFDFLEIFINLIHFFDFLHQIVRISISIILHFQSLHNILQILFNNIKEIKNVNLLSLLIFRNTL